MLHHAFKKLASYSLSCLMFCVSFYRSVPLFKCSDSTLIYDVSDVNSIIISLNRATGLQILLDVTHSTRHKAAA